MTTCARADTGACFNYPFLTSKERDNETGLDYFLARYYSSTQGRFTSPDEFTGGPDELYYFVDDAAANPTFYADLRKPQSLNKYQYAFNNPLRYVDPDGHDAEEVDPDPDPPQGQTRSIPIPRGPGPTPAEAQQTIEAIKALDRWIDKQLLPIKEIIGTATPQTIDPIVTAPTTPLPAPQVQPLPPPPPMEARSHRKGKRKSTEKKHQEGTARKQRDYGGEKGDVVRRPPRRPPGGKTPKGGWPPKPPEPPKPKPPEPPKPKPPPEPKLPG